MNKVMYEKSNVKTMFGRDINVICLLHLRRDWNKLMINQ